MAKLTSWYRDKEGYVARKYEWPHEANRELKEAQRSGWSLYSVSVAGKRMEPDESPAPWKGFVYPHPVRRKADRVEIRFWPGILGTLGGALMLAVATQGFGQTGWDIEVSYGKQSRSTAE